MALWVRVREKHSTAALRRCRKYAGKSHGMRAVWRGCAKKPHRASVAVLRLADGIWTGPTRENCGAGA